MVASCKYSDLVKYVVKYILNEEIGICEYDDIKFNLDNIYEIDDGDYQGTLLYVIPFDTYQPASFEYIMAHCNYGSCSGCDTLLAIQDETKDEVKLDSYMTLCRHIVCNIVKPYNEGWRYNEIFKTVEE